MCRDSLFLPNLIGWFLLSISNVSANTKSTCEVECLCDALPACWNQLSCCPASFIDREVRSSNDAMRPEVEHFSNVDGFMPSAREPRSPGREWSIHSTKKRGTDVQNWQNSSCVYPFVHSEPLLDEFKAVVVGHQFRVVHDCRGNHSGSDLHTKCLAFRNISNLESVIPVVDGNTMTIYANRFCAECSDIQDFEAFLHQFICSNALLGQWELLSLERTQENQLNLIRSGLCVYFIKPPDKETLKIPENRCLSAKYTNCNQAGDAVVIDKNYWHDCLTTLSLPDGNLCAFCSDQIDSMLALLNQEIIVFEQHAMRDVQRTLILR